LAWEVEEEGSMVIPPEASDEVNDGHDGGVDHSGEDDSSGDDSGDVDRSKRAQHGEGNKAGGESYVCMQKQKEGEVSLTCVKSTNNVIPQTEILPVPSVCEDTEEVGERHVVKEYPLEDVSKSGEIDKCITGGSQGAAEREIQVEGVGGPVPLGDSSQEEVVGLSDPSIQVVSGHEPLGQWEANPLGLGRLVDDGELRYSSFSEPEEALSSHRTKNPKTNPKLRRQKSSSKFNKLGVPKCFQLVEAMKEAGVRGRRRRARSGGDTTSIVEGVVEVGDSSKSRRLKQMQGENQSVTPTSGINLLSKDADLRDKQLHLKVRMRLN
jgi:hypothetical protein